MTAALILEVAALIGLVALMALHRLDVEDVDDSAARYDTAWEKARQQRWPDGWGD